MLEEEEGRAASNLSEYEAARITPFLLMADDAPPVVQFGIKSGDKVKGGADKVKLNNQLGQIERLLKEKGHDHSGAFAKEGKPKRVDPNEGIDPSLATPARAKKQRI